ncbi:hypothetical protein RD792_000975 [Penstemon davidsonii]|uniref:BFN domain-containing protein n=1 Tax=Penstemon davidsonii TaxID=160366 RepID=A0ABR0DM55_9LAMI|nr:hypothetical protein RD792_000975 [Penstemon davidsonii]
MHSKGLKMASLQGPVVCPVFRAKKSGVHSVPVNSPLLKAKLVRSGLWGLKGLHSGSTRVGFRKQCRPIQCSFSSSSNGNGSMAENSNENDADYVNSTVVEAVEVRSGSDGFMIKMRDGERLRCVHNNPRGGQLPDYAPHPAIVLKMEDTGLLLPIIVLEMPSVLLMAAVRNVQIARPTMYQVVKNMIEKMGYAVKLVRVTKRVHEAYFAEIHLVKRVSPLIYDPRMQLILQSDARCQYKSTSYWHIATGVRVIESAKVSVQSTSSNGLLFAELERPNGQPCIETKEFDLVRNMLIAAVEERYRDAGDISAVNRADFNPDPFESDPIY